MTAETFDRLPELLALADSLPEPRVFIGADYRVLGVNQAWRQEFGDPGSGERFCYQMSHHAEVPCDQMGEICPLKQSRETGETARALHIHQTPHGPEHVDAEVCPIRDAAGRPLFYVETMRMVRRASSRPSAEGLVGRSPAFNRMLALIERVAPSEATVLLLGRLAARLGRPDEAEARLRAAHLTAERGGLVPLADAARAALDELTARSGPRSSG
jgi:hypothetical protein